MRKSFRIFVFFLAYFGGAEFCQALSYKYGFFGGFSYTDFGSGLPERFSPDTDKTALGAYTGATGGFFLSDGFARPVIEVSPQYVMQSVDNLFTVHNIFVPSYFSLYLDDGAKFFGFGAGTGPMFVDIYRESNFDWGIFGKASTGFRVLEDRGYIGPHFQFFVDVTSPKGSKIWGILAGLSWEIHRGRSR